MAIAPVSNFILLEEYAENRQAKTWTSAMEEAIEGLPVEIIQSTSDEGKGLLRHVEVDLGVHHSPDVFHVQHEVVKGTGGALASKERKAKRAFVEAEEKVGALRRALEESTGRSEKLTERFAEAQHEEQVAQQALAIASAQRERARQAVQGISASYHPYDPSPVRKEAPKKCRPLLKSISRRSRQSPRRAPVIGECFQEDRKGKEGSDHDGRNHCLLLAHGQGQSGSFGVGA